MKTRTQRRADERRKKKYVKKERQKRIMSLAMVTTMALKGVTVFASTPEGEKNVKRTLPVYFQGGDNTWAWTNYSSNVMATDGCGPTSMAMIVEGLKANWIGLNIDSEYGIADAFDPYDAALYSREIGAEHPYAGTDQTVLFPKLAESTGLKYTNTMDSSVAYEALKNGGAVIANEMWTGEDGTVYGHFFVLSNLTEDGKVVVNDPFAYTNWERANDRHMNPKTMDEIDDYIGSGTGYHIFENENLPEIKSIAEESKEEKSVTDEAENVENIEVEEAVDTPVQEEVIGSLVFGKSNADESTIEQVNEETQIGSLIFKNEVNDITNINSYSYLNISEAMEDYKNKSSQNAIYSNQEVELILTSLNLFCRMEKINPNIAMKLMFEKSAYFTYEGVEMSKDSYNFAGLVNKKGALVKYESLTEGVKSYVQYLKRLTTEDKLVLEAKNNDAIKAIKNPGKIANTADLAKVLNMSRESIDAIVQAL